MGNPSSSVTHELRGRIGELAKKLDALGPAPSLVDLADVMDSTRLMRVDVEAFVERNAHHYHRTTVVSNDHYELLVMTWLPGQSSLPHDHANSLCVVQVVEGQATEGTYRIAADGYVDLDYETTVSAGQVTSGQDRGVHTLRNGSSDGELLVTVHAYVPPLRDFRQFVPRPVARQRETTRRVDEPPTIVVVGGGFSGSMTAAQILRRSGHEDSRVRVVLVERRGALGEGVAYATRDAAHLLNVPAGKMSAWPDRPDDFLRWAAEHHGPIAPTDFLRRQWYADYIRETLLTAARRSADTASLTVLLDEVCRIARRPEGGWLVHLATGVSIDADAVVLAIGHRPPSDPLAGKWSGPRSRFIGDPWRPFALSMVKEDEPAVVLGSGLTAVDAVMSLANRGRTSITLVSRNGLLPQAHAARPLPPADLGAVVARLIATPSGVRALAVLRELRAVVRERAAAGGDWRSVFDGLRPHTQALWQALPIGERRKFLARLRPYWEAHRHRMALAVAEQFGAMRESGEVRTIAGRLISAQADTDVVRLKVEERRTGRPVELTAAWIINCTGPTPSNSAASNPAIGSLLVDGHLRSDELGLGIETSADGHAIAADGTIVPDLLLVGTLRKPALWETTAVPELREQASKAAEQALAFAIKAARRPNFALEPIVEPY